VAVGNGKDADVTSLPEAIDLAGGHWCGADILRQQLEHMEQHRRAQAAALQAAVNMQMAMEQAGAEADRAEHELVAALKSSDYAAAGKASRRLAHWEARLVVLMFPVGG
jgi:hypothetical protein